MSRWVMIGQILKHLPHYWPHFLGNLTANLFCKKSASDIGGQSRGFSPVGGA